MTADRDPTQHLIESLSVKREFPRFRVTITVRLRGEDLERGLLEERTVTEDIGQGGAMLFTTLPFMEGDLLEMKEVGGSFLVRARVVGAFLGTDNISRLNVQFLGEDAPDRARELLRRLGLLSTGRVTVVSQIPAAPSEQVVIEAALRDVFKGVPGDWTVHLVLADGFTPPWWLLSFEGLGEFFRMSFRPTEQNPQFIQDRVREALTRRKLIR